MGGGWGGGGGGRRKEKGKILKGGCWTYFNSSYIPWEAFAATGTHYHHNDGNKYDENDG